MNLSELLYCRLCTLIAYEAVMKQTARARHLMSREAYPMSVVKKIQFAMIVFACLACFSESLSAAPETIVNKKDLKVARKTAKTSEDHQRIANYYQEQAKKLQVKERKGKEERDWRITVSRTPACTASNIRHPVNHKGLADYTTRLGLRRSKRLTNR